MYGFKIINKQMGAKLEIQERNYMPKSFRVVQTEEEKKKVDKQRDHVTL